MKFGSSSTARAIAVAAVAVVAIGAPAQAGKKGVAKHDDEKSTGGKFYDQATYARCDIDWMSAKKKGKQLQVVTKFRGQADGGPIDTLWVNTKGNKRSAPEYSIRPGPETAMIYKMQRVKNPPPGFPPTQAVDTGKTGKVKLKGKKETVKLKASHVAKGKKKVGLQAQTCGEGAVDIAPGGHYFDDTGYDGTIDRKYLNVKV